MDNSEKQNASVQPVTGEASKKVVQPSSSFAEEMKATTSAASTPMPSEASQQPSHKSIYPEPTKGFAVVPPSNAPNAVPGETKNAYPVGMSASQLGLNGPGKHFDLMRYAKAAVKPLAVLAVLIGGFLTVHGYFTGMDTKTVTNKGYTYSFSFYRGAKSEQLSNATVYEYKKSIIAGAAPTTTPLKQYCAEYGFQWTEAFSVQMYGQTREVCVTGTYAFGVYFTALNHTHIATVVYNQPQTTKVYPTVRKIFESVKVSQ